MYARVSTTDKGQNPEIQLQPMRERAKSENWEIYKEYIDRETGTDFERKYWEQLMEDAKHHKFDAVYFWSLDRFSRVGVFESIEILNRIRSYGIRYISHQEWFLNTMGSFGDVLVALFLWMAQQESKRHGERVLAGMNPILESHKRLGVWKTKSGKPIGRPQLKLDAVILAKIKKLHLEGASLREIRYRLLKEDGVKVSHSKLGKIFKSH